MLLQLPSEHDHVLGTDVAVWQSSLSAEPVPVHVPVHCLSLLTHLALEQSESSTQRHAVLSVLMTGGGVRVVVHEVPPVPTQATELGAGMHPFPSSAPVPVQPAQMPLCELGMQCPLAHATSAVQ